MSPLEIKVCGNKDQVNLEQVCQLYPDYVGFIFYPESKRFVSNQTLLSPACGSSVKRVGVFVNSTQEEIKEKIEAFDLDYIQLHGDESPEFCRQIDAVKPVFKVFKINDEFNFNTLKYYLSVCYAFLFDTDFESYGGSGKKFNWELLSDYKLNKPFFLSGGITPDDVQKIRNLKHPMLKGIDINSRFEKTPGIKNIHLLTTFFNQIRA